MGVVRWYNLLSEDPNSRNLSAQEQFADCILTMEIAEDIKLYLSARHFLKEFSTIFGLNVE